MTTTAAEIAAGPPIPSVAAERQSRRQHEAAAKLVVAVAAPERPGLHPDPLRTTFASPTLSGCCTERSRLEIAAWLLGGHVAGGCTHGGTR